MRTHILKTLLLIGLVTFVHIANAQDSTMLPKNKPQQKRFLDNVFFGGNLSMQFGNRTFIDVSPFIGYKFTKKFSGGVGATYECYHYRDGYYDFETNVYGGRVFGRYYVNTNLFAHAELEYLNLEAFDFTPRRRVDVESFLAGGGYIQRIGDNAAIVAMLLYNFTESLYTPYTNPIIRIGINIGF